MLSYETTVLLTICHITIWFFLLFVGLPRLLFPTTTVKPGPSHLFDHVVRLSFAAIVIIHLLAFLNIFDLFSLVTAFGLVYLGYQALICRTPLGANARRLWQTGSTSFFDWLDGQISLLPYLKKQPALAWNRLAGALPRGTDLWWGMALGIVLIISGYLRLYELVWGPAPASADIYLHLFWFKGLGLSRLYPDGLYPSGSYALLQLLYQFTLIDGVLLLRLLPGLNGVLLVAAIYWSVNRLTGRRSAALLAAAIYGIFAFAGWLPLPLPPEGDVLTVETALIFLLPTLVFLTEALAPLLKATARNTGPEPVDERTAPGAPSPSATVLYFQGLACLFFIQPFVGLLGLLAAGGGILTVAMLNRRFRPAARLLNVGLGAALVGLSPLLIGLAQGKSLHLGPLRWDVHFFGARLRPLNFLPEPPPAPDPTPLLYLGLAGALGLILLSLRRPGPDRTLATGWQLFGAGLLILTLLFMPDWFGLPEFLLPGQVARALALLLSVVIGLSLQQIWTFLARLTARFTQEDSRLWPQYLEVSLTVSVIIVLLLPFPSILIPEPTLAVTARPKQEYDSAAAQLFRIKEEIPTYKWTVVSYPEALPQVFGQGFSITNEDFLESYRPETWQFDPRRPELAIPSPHVFIFIEKHPYIVPGDTVAEALERDLIQDRLQAWVDRYRELHADMSLYYEDGRLAIYHIYRTPEEEKRILEAIEQGQMPIGIAPPPTPTPGQAAETPASDDPPPTPAVLATPVITYEVKRGDIRETLTFDGQIAPAVQQSLFFQTAGRISVTHAAEGDAVSRGQTLVELETAGLEQALAAARADLAAIEDRAEAGPDAAAAKIAALELEIARLELEAGQRRATGPSPTETGPELERAFLTLHTAENNFNAIQQALDAPAGQNDLKQIWNDPWVWTVFQRATALEDAAKNHLQAQLAYDQAQQALVQYDYELAIGEGWVELARLELEALTADPTALLQRAIDRAETNLDRVGADLAAAQEAVEQAAPQDSEALAAQFERLRDLEQQQAEADLALKQAQADLAAAETGQSRAVKQAELALQRTRLELEQLQAQKPDLDFALLQAKTGLERSAGDLKKAEDKYFQVARDGVQPPELLALHQAQMDFMQAEVAHARAANSLSDSELRLLEYEVEQVRLDAGQSAGETATFDAEKGWALLEIQQLEEEIAAARLVAPLDGVVLSMPLRPGQFVAAFQPVAIVADVNQLEVRVDQVTLEMRRLLVPGLPVTVAPLATGQPERPGRIRQTPAGPAAESGSQDVPDALRITFDAPATELGYRLGDRVRVRAGVKHKARVLWLPPPAILTGPEGRPYVLTPDGNGEQAVEVEIGLRTEDQVEILAGLKEGQTVIVK